MNIRQTMSLALLLAGFAATNAVSTQQPHSPKGLESSAPAGSTNSDGAHLGDAWSDPRNPIVQIFGGQRLGLWSFHPVKDPPVPLVQLDHWPRNPIDYFVLARLENEGLLPSPEADRRTLARRLHFDLTGLPPTPEEMDAFLMDVSPGAYERLVDRLLDSPGYGEHWARHWLDVVRYSDSNGFDWDEFRPEAWRFRDYVIRSLNADKPFDQFIREQLAGDELLAGPPQDSMEQDFLVATGFLRLGPHDNSAPLFDEEARSRAELMADLVETTGSAFLGLTLSCARCHDHKSDPISQADHFRLRAFFEQVRFAPELHLDLALEQENIRRHNTLLDERIAPLRKEREEILSAVKQRLRNERLATLAPGERALLLLPEADQTEELKEQISDLRKMTEPDEKEVMAALEGQEQAVHKEISSAIDVLEKQKRSFTSGLLMTDAEGEPPVTRILFQGDHKQEREPVVPGFLSALDPNPASILKPVNPATTGRRLTLAEWIVSPENPFTSRVLVNRVWQGHFGRGLAATASDFGLAGDSPTHPELLDWLAKRFVRDGWSLKKLHRLMVTSAAYRQSSSVAAAMTSGTSLSPRKLDSENHLLWRQNPKRLSAEQLRDSLLAVSGLLKPKEGGPPIWPELPPEVLQANPAFLDDNAEKTKGWYPSPPEDQHFRSIYLVQKRTVRIPFLETFDLPENSTSCARRNESIVAPQALSLMNSPWTIEAARAFAARIQDQAGEKSDDQVSLAFALALQRSPDPAERQACLELLQNHTLTELCRALLNLNELMFVD